MQSRATEDYIKAVFFEEHNTPGNLARTVKLAKSLGVTPGTATVMLQNLAKEGLLDYYSRKGCRLTERGKKLALMILRKHRLIELFLQKILHFDWSEVHEEAERMEHCFSEKVINRLDKILGYPKTDPHGEVIPDITKPPEEGIDQLKGKDILLTETKADSTYRITRIINQDSGFLIHMQELGIVPNAVITIVSQDTIIDVMKMKHGNSKKTLTLSLSAAGFIYVVPIG
jgi:DtxR family Mn-dependent transcriptional regulator